MLAEFGTIIPDDVEVRVSDSTATVRFLVLPLRPDGTEGWSEAELAALVTRDAMIGVIPRHSRQGSRVMFGPKALPACRTISAASMPPPSAASIMICCRGKSAATRSPTCSICARSSTPRKSAKGVEALGASLIGELSYYERWIVVFANLSFAKGFFAPSELARKMVEVADRYDADHLA